MSKLKVTKAVLDKNLSKEVKEHFAVDNTKLTSLHYIDQIYGEINLKTMSKKRAELLVKEGCPFLKLKPISKKDSK